MDDVVQDMCIGMAKMTDKDLMELIADQSAIIKESQIQIEAASILLQQRLQA